MATCSQCGAPISFATEASVVCEFCHTTNRPPPKEVPVPVPVQIVQNVIQVVGGAASDAARELRCPHCRKLLVTVRAADVDLNGCGGCGGIWIDNAAAKRVIASPERIFGELAMRAGANARGTAPRAERPVCAQCPAVLDRVPAHGIDLDICTEHGTWFDAYELDRLTAVLRGEPVAGIQLRPGSTVKCAGCGVSMRAQDATIGDDGLVCDACWRKRQGQLRAQADQKLHQESGAVAGVMLAGMIAGAILGVSTSRS